MYGQKGSGAAEPCRERGRLCNEEGLQGKVVRFAKDLGRVGEGRSLLEGWGNCWAAI